MPYNKDITEILQERENILKGTVNILNDLQSNSSAFRKCSDFKVTYNDINEEEE